MTTRDPRLDPEPGDLLRMRSGTAVVVTEVDHFVPERPVHFRVISGARSTDAEAMPMRDWRDFARYFSVEALAEHAHEPEVVAPVLWKGEDGTWRIRQLQITGPLGRMRWADGGNPTEKELSAMADELRRMG